MKYFKVIPEGELIKCLYNGKRVIRGRGLETKCLYRIDLRQNKVYWI